MSGTNSFEISNISQEIPLKIEVINFKFDASYERNTCIQIRNACVQHTESIIEEEIVPKLKTKREQIRNTLIAFLDIILVLIFSFPQEFSFINSTRIPNYEPWFLKRKLSGLISACPNNLSLISLKKKVEQKAVLICHL